jgi:hypothetical protein
MIPSVPFLSDGYKKNNNWQYLGSPIYVFGQQRLNGANDWSAGRVLPNSEHIVSGALTLSCPMAAAFQFPCGQLVVGQSMVRPQ